MAVKIARGTVTRIREWSGGFVLQVRDASEAALALEALQSACAEIRLIDGSPAEKRAAGLGDEDALNPNYVGSVLPAATGPFVYIDAKAVPTRLLKTIPEIVRLHLERLGVADAKIAVPQAGGTLEYLRWYPNAVLLRLYPASSTPRDGCARVPPLWLGEGVRWVEGGLGEQGQVLVSVNSIEFPLELPELPAFLEQCRQLRADSCDVVAGPSPIPPPPAVPWRLGVDDLRAKEDALARLGGRVRLAKLCHGWERSHLVLAAAGPRLGPPELAAELEELKRIARRLAPELAYAFMTAQETLMVQNGEMAGWSPAAPRAAPELSCDQVVFDAFPYQVLGPGHVERLGAAPRGARVLAGARIELELPEQRLGTPAIREAAWATLRPCLLVEREVHALLNAHAEQPGFEYAPAQRDPPAFVLEARRRPVGASDLEERVYKLAPRAELGICPGPVCRLTDPLTAPASLLRALCAWVTGDGDGELWGILEYTCFALSAADAPELFDYARAQRCSYVAIDPDGLTRSIAWSFSHGLVLVAGLPAGRGLLAGPAAYEPLIAPAERLKQLARDVAADLSYASLHLGPSAYPPFGPWAWSSRGGTDAWMVRQRCDEFVPDGFHFQVLGPGHLERLGGMPPGARPLPGGRAELEFGELREWLVPDRAAGRRILAPCLITEAEERELLSSISAPT